MKERLTERPAIYNVHEEQIWAGELLPKMGSAPAAQTDIYCQSCLFTYEIDPELFTNKTQNNPQPIPHCHRYSTKQYESPRRLDLNFDVGKSMFLKQLESFSHVRLHCLV